MDATLRDAIMNFYRDAHTGAKFIGSALGADVLLLTRKTHVTSARDIPIYTYTRVCEVLYFVRFPEHFGARRSPLSYYYIQFYLLGTQRGDEFSRHAALHHSSKAVHLSNISNVFVMGAMVAYVNWQTHEDLDVLVDLIRKDIADKEEVYDIVRAVNWNTIREQVEHDLARAFPHFAKEGIDFYVLFGSIKCSHGQGTINKEIPGREWQQLSLTAYPPYRATVLLRFQPRKHNNLSSLLTVTVRCNFTIAEDKSTDVDVVLVVPKPYESQPHDYAQLYNEIAAAHIKGAKTPQEITDAILRALPEALNEHLFHRWRQAREYREQLVRRKWQLRDVTAIIQEGVILTCTQWVARTLRAHRPYGFVNCWARIATERSREETKHTIPGTENRTDASSRNCMVQFVVWYSWAHEDITLPVSMHIYTTLLCFSFKGVPPAASIRCAVSATTVEHINVEAHPLIDHQVDKSNMQADDFDSNIVRALIAEISTQLVSALLRTPILTDKILHCVDDAWRAHFGSTTPMPGSAAYTHEAEG